MNDIKYNKVNAKIMVYNTIREKGNVGWLLLMNENQFAYEDCLNETVILFFSHKNTEANV